MKNKLEKLGLNSLGKERVVKEEVGNVLGRAVSLPCGTPPAPHPCPIPRFLDVGAGAIYRILIINIIDT